MRGLKSVLRVSNVTGPIPTQVIKERTLLTYVRGKSSATAVEHIVSVAIATLAKARREHEKKDSLSTSTKTPVRQDLNREGPNRNLLARIPNPIPTPLGLP